jgi:hypothetical protein
MKAFKPVKFEVFPVWKMLVLVFWVVILSRLVGDINIKIFEPASKIGN